MTSEEEAMANNDLENLFLFAGSPIVTSEEEAMAETWYPMLLMSLLRPNPAQFT